MVEQKLNVQDLIYLIGEKEVALALKRVEVAKALQNIQALQVQLKAVATVPTEGQG